MNKLSLVCCCLALGVGTLTYAQESATESATQGESTPTIPRKAKKAKKKQRSQPPVEAADDSLQPAKKSSVWFPDWGAPKFNAGVHPVVGLIYSNEDDHWQLTYELGVGAQISGIPVHEGNPGAYVNPRGGYAWGQTRTHVEGLDTDTVSFNRIWVGNDLNIPVRFFRYTLGIDYGEIHGHDVSTVQKLMVSNDFAVLFLPILSGHLTHTYGRLYGRLWDGWQRTNNDYWLHARFQIEKLYLDGGPGVAWSTTYSPLGDKSSSLTYLRALGGWDLIWNLGISLHARYVVSVSEDSGSTVAVTRDPTEDLNAVRRSPTPVEDTFDAHFFAGMKNFLGGFGVGWIWTMQSLHALERDGLQRQTTRKNGLGIVYQASF